MTLADLQEGNWFRFIGDDIVRRVSSVAVSYLAQKARMTWTYQNATDGHFGNHVIEKKAKKLEVMPLAFIDASLFATTN